MSGHMTTHIPNALKLITKFQATGCNAIVTRRIQSLFLLVSIDVMILSVLKSTGFKLFVSHTGNSLNTSFYLFYPQSH